METSIFNPAATTTTWVTKGSGTKTLPIEGEASLAPWHRIEIWSDTWDTTGLDYDYVRVSTSDGYVTTDQGIFRENRAIVVRGPLTAVYIAETHLKAASATAVKCRIQSGGADLACSTRFVKARSVIAGDHVGTVIDLPDCLENNNGIEGYTEFHVTSNLWGVGSSAAFTAIYPSGQTDLFWTATTNDDDLSFFLSNPSMGGLTVTTAGSGVNQMYYVETCSRVQND